jgi:type IV pilus assembly protein PilC
LVNKGEGLSEPLDKIEYIPKTIVYMTRLGEESGALDVLLTQLADFYDDESESAIQALTTMIEPLMIILMAAVVLPVVMAIIAPVFGLANVMT